ncbi:unnamed protein product, partial [Mesorhabditis belari]|uniref:Transmembrane 9 superfamily member n=1 Tax=Mesorhabditis belari TaxID=2138241 RepID=A0AAF3FJA1_9BILA
MSLILFLLLFGIHLTHGAVNMYQSKEKVDVFVNKVGPYANIHETYHFYSLPICRPEKIIHKSLSLGQVLEGDRVAESTYIIHFGENMARGSLCGDVALDLADTERLIRAIEEDYYFEIIIDDLRVRNFLGFIEESKQVFPHIHRIFLYTESIISFEINEKNQIINIDLKMVHESAVEIEEGKGFSVDFQYSVKWNKTNKTLSSRPSDGQVLFSTRSMHIHWLSVINSVLLVLLLIMFVALILFSAVRRDLAQYNEGDEQDLLMDNGWKTVAMDVFRKPKHPMLLSAILGVGTQFLIITSIILIIASFNILNLHRHGMLNTILIFLYALTSFIAGFVSSSKYAQLDGKNWIVNVHLTMGLFAAPMITVWTINNSVAWVNNSTQALPWTTVSIVLLIALIIGYPLAIMGAILGSSLSKKYEAPCRTRNVPRQIPALPWYHSTPSFCIVAGFLPFSAISVELYYIFSTIWGRETYTLFYMLAIVFCIVLWVTASISIGLTYSQLNAEDYHWWWRSIFNGGFVQLIKLFAIHKRICLFPCAQQSNQ